jgi:hypothetical protein
MNKKIYYIPLILILCFSIIFVVYPIKTIGLSDEGQSYIDYLAEKYGDEEPAEGTTTVINASDAVDTSDLQEAYEEWEEAYETPEHPNYYTETEPFPEGDPEVSYGWVEGVGYGYVIVEDDTGGSSSHGGSGNGNGNGNGNGDGNGNESGEAIESQPSPTCPPGQVRPHRECR